MTTNKKAFTLRLKPENFEKIKYIADKNKRSIAKQIEYVLEQHIEEFEEKEAEKEKAEAAEEAEAEDKKGDSITPE
ncbi:hypothetical protein [Paenibacillus kribbensis]|uniref:hypothetical protein n=1 Tax=Paenibacillus kribbensis TaxID=172713 RepID=UPI00211865CF|nr:hypothetical protein [Paenibacillus kribbensis]